jgi:hypothetical protein
MQDSLRLKPQEVANLILFSLPSVSQSNNQTSPSNLLSVNRVADADIEFVSCKETITYLLFRPISGLMQSHLLYIKAYQLRTAANL